uniref:MIF4G domain-containing protein n=1 Tax=Vitrella brassicaformis TaxID=1169539 RepID=A0A7S1KH29_9ALVE
MDKGDKADGQKEGTEEDKEFRRILLNRCQESFEKYLKPPDNLNDLTGDDYTEAYFKYKNQMLGNIKFVGQLLIERILSAKLLFVCLDELWHYGEKQGKQGEAQFECVCTFLTTIGPVYDVAQDWNRRADLQQWFHKLEEKSRDENLGIRVRCLMKDVLDLRANGWRQVVKPGKVQGPSKLRDIHRQHVEEKGEDIVLSKTNLELRGLAPPSEGLLPTPSAAPEPPAADEWATVGGRKNKPAQQAAAAAAAASVWG